MNLKDSIGGIGGRKSEEEMIQLYYNFKNSTRYEEMTVKMKLFTPLGCQQAYYKFDVKLYYI